MENPRGRQSGPGSCHRWSSREPCSADAWSSCSRVSVAPIAAARGVVLATGHAGQVPARDPVFWASRRSRPSKPRGPGIGSRMCSDRRRAASLSRCSQSAPVAAKSGSAESRTSGVEHVSQRGVLRFGVHRGRLVAPRQPEQGRHRVDAGHGDIASSTPLDGSAGVRDRLGARNCRSPGRTPCRPERTGRYAAAGSDEAVACRSRARARSRRREGGGCNSPGCRVSSCRATSPEPTAFRSPPRRFWWSARSTARATGGRPTFSAGAAQAATPWAPAAECRGRCWSSNLDDLRPSKAAVVSAVTNGQGVMLSFRGHAHGRPDPGRRRVRQSERREVARME